MGSVFESIVGAAHVEPVTASLLDGVPVVQRVRPGSAGEVAECLRAASLDRVALVVRGGGSKLAWGNPGTAPSWVRLDTDRLCQTCEVEPEEGIVRVGAGLGVDALERVLAPVARTTRLPAGYAGATVGGSVAADPPDARRTLDRCLRNDLLGLEVALANGSLTRCGGRVVKNVTGFDLVRLYCGSLGTLGVITEVTLRLRPRPAARAFGLCETDDVAGALDCLAEEMGRGVDPDAALVVPAARGQRLLWLVEGSADDVADRVRRARGEAVAAEDWERAARVLSEPFADAVTLRLGTRATELPDAWSALKAWTRDAPRVALPIPGTVRAVGDAAGLPELHALCARRGWSCFVESAPLEAKHGLDVFGPASSAVALMRALKARFDPEGVLAPGRFVGGV